MARQRRNNIALQQRRIRPDNKSHLKSPFLKNLKSMIYISQAAEATGVSRRLVYQWRDEDKDFREKMDDLETRSLDLLRSEAFRRAVVGVDEPVSIGGRREMVKKYSDYLLDRLLRAKDPAFKDTLRVDVHLNFVTMLVGKLQQIIQRTAPIKCPHCRQMLNVRQEMAQELAQLGNMDAADITESL